MDMDFFELFTDFVPTVLSNFSIYLAYCVFFFYY